MRRKIDGRLGGRCHQRHDEAAGRGPASEIGDSLVADGVVKISSFGTFSVRRKGRRIGRNPKTGEEVPIMPRRVLVFRPSQLLKDRINGHGEVTPDAEEN